MVLPGSFLRTTQKVPIKVDLHLPSKSHGTRAPWPLATSAARQLFHRLGASPRLVGSMSLLRCMDVSDCQKLGTSDQTPLGPPWSCGQGGGMRALYLLFGRMLRFPGLHFVRMMCSSDAPTALPLTSSSTSAVQTRTSCRVIAESWHTKHL